MIFITKRCFLKGRILFGSTEIQKYKILKIICLRKCLPHVKKNKKCDKGQNDRLVLFGNFLFDIRRM